MPDERVVDDHREVARHLQLVAAAHGDPVDPGDRRLAELAQPVVHVLEGAEPLPVLLRLADERLVPGAQVGADAERAALPVTTTTRISSSHEASSAGARDLAQHPEVERVEDVRAVEPDRRPWRRLLVDDRLEAELGRVDRARVARLAHSIETKWTVNGMPIAIASRPWPQTARSWPLP